MLKFPKIESYIHGMMYNYCIMCFMNIQAKNLKHIFFAFLLTAVFGAALSAASTSQIQGDQNAIGEYSKESAIVDASNDTSAKITPEQNPLQNRNLAKKQNQDKYLSFGAAIVAGILLSILANALHAWLGITALCIIAQKIVPIGAFDGLSVPYLSDYTLRSPEFLTFLIAACIIETLQKWIPVVKIFFNFLNTFVKPLLAVLMIDMIAKFANPDISNLILRPMECLGAVTVFGLHIGKHYIKALTTAHINPPSTWTWASIELVATLLIVGLGVWALV
ncbi:MAG: DUF4126 family protein [Elusimicrobiota bacterium]|nr:DUF4126 family protein [Elusimicrobiota bacterium]